MLQNLPLLPKISSQPLPKHASIFGFPSRAAPCKRDESRGGGLGASCPWLAERLGEQIPALWEGRHLCLPCFPGDAAAVRMGVQAAACKL